MLIRTPSVASEKRRTRQAWDAEWGRIGREGNMWWLGDTRAHWEQVFGPQTWTWLRMSSHFYFGCIGGLTAV